MLSHSHLVDLEQLDSIDFQKMNDRKVNASINLPQIRLDTLFFHFEQSPSVILQTEIAVPLLCQIFFLWCNSDPLDADEFTVKIVCYCSEAYF